MGRIKKFCKGQKVNTPNGLGVVDVDLGSGPAPVRVFFMESATNTFRWFARKELTINASGNEI